MAFENVKELLKAVKTDPEAKKALQGLEKPKDEEGVVGYYVEAVKRLGYAVTEEDIRKAIADLTQKQEAKTEEAAGQIKAVPDDELDHVAGGYDNTECFDTFKNKENCWFADGCDVSILPYSNYECKKNTHGKACLIQDEFDCNSAIF